MGISPAASLILSEWLSFSFFSFFDTHNHQFFFWSTQKKKKAQLVKVEMTKLHTTLLPKRHHLVFILLVYYILGFIRYSRLLADKLHDLGLRVFYDWMLVFSTRFGSSVYMQFASDGVVCPANLLSNVFTTFVVDSIDRNPGSRSAKILGMEQ